MNATSSISSSMSGASWLERSKQLFQQFDTSGDGSIDFEEFKAAGPKDGKGKAGGLDPAEMFAKIDTNGDGKIDESEHTTFMKQMEANRPEKGAGDQGSVFSDIADLIKSLDTNGDNSIDQDEQEAFLKKLEELRKQMQSSLQSYSGDAKSTGTSSSVFSLLM
jgi:Ca2+-binding EF-hand superfamily protein